MQENELVRDDQSYFIIKCEMDDEDAVHAMDLFENDDTFLEFMGARTKYLAKHKKGLINIIQIYMLILVNLWKIKLKG